MNVWGIDNRVADALTEETPETRAAVIRDLKALATTANAKVTAAEAALKVAKTDQHAVALLLDGITGGPVNRAMNDALMGQLTRSKHGVTKVYLQAKCDDTRDHSLHQWTPTWAKPGPAEYICPGRIVV